MSQSNIISRMFFSFRFRLWIGATLINGLLITGIIFFSYIQNKKILLETMASRLLDTGRNAVEAVSDREKEAIVRFTTSLRENRMANLDLEALKPGDYLPSISDETANRLLKNEDFLLLVKRLRKLKLRTIEVNETTDLFNGPVSLSYYSNDLYRERKDRSAISYAYMAIPYGENRDDLIVYIADADYEATDDADGNPPGNIYRIKQKSFRSAMKGEPACEKEFIADGWGVWLTAAVPIIHEGKVIAFMGVDYDVSGDANRINDLFYTSILMALAFLPVSFLLLYFLASLLTSPLRAVSEAANRVRNRDFSTEIVLKQRDEIGKLADTFNQMVASIRGYSTELEDVNRAYYKFVPREFLDQLGIDSFARISLGHEVRKEMTVLFSDIRSFTTISEGMTPEENFTFLNSYLNAVAPRIRDSRGFIDKFIGDAIMALFPDEAADAIDAGIAIIKDLNEYNERTRERGWPPVRIGVGIHTGNLMMGTIGEEMRLQTTVISDAVNLASRLESLTKKLGVQIIVSRDTMEKATAAGKDFSFRYLGSVRVKGKVNAVDIFEVLDCLDEEFRARRIVSREKFNHGVKILQEGHIGDAKAIFEKILEADPEDGAARFFFSRASR